MDRAAFNRWRAARTWEHAWESAPLRFALDVELGIMVCKTEVGYAECTGPSDPFCGRCRFSVHGCNGAPSRAVALAWRDA